MNTKTDKLVQKITKMEQDLIDSVGKMQKLENSLAKAYANDGDIEKAHSELSKYREKVQDQVAALRSLDQMAAATSKEEREEINAAIEAEGEQRFKSAYSDAAAAFDTLQKKIASHVGATLAARVAEDGLNHTGSVIDDSVISWKADQRRERLPDVYQIAKRDDKGRVTFEVAGHSFYQDFRFKKQRTLPSHHRVQIATGGPFPGLNNLFPDSDEGAA